VFSAMQVRLRVCHFMQASLFVAVLLSNELIPYFEATVFLCTDCYNVTFCGIFCTFYFVTLIFFAFLCILFIATHVLLLRTVYFQLCLYALEYLKHINQNSAHSR